jgi:hypothetical protein
MQNHDKTQPAIGRHRFEKPPERLHAARRSADTDNLQGGQVQSGSIGSVTFCALL